MLASFSSWMRSRQSFLLCNDLFLMPLLCYLKYSPISVIVIQYSFKDSITGASGDIFSSCWISEFTRINSLYCVKIVIQYSFKDVITAAAGGIFSNCWISEFTLINSLYCVKIFLWFIKNKTSFNYNDKRLNKKIILFVPKFCFK